MLSIDIQKKLGTAGGEIELSIQGDFPEGALVAVFGKSGVGKTTLLRILAGLSRPDFGKISLGGQVWNDSAKGVFLPPQQRKVGFVFQDYGLFPHLTVLQNISFGTEGKQARLWVKKLMESAALGSLRDRLPASLSGGQQQRVALVRALACRPRLLLLDEALSALDREMRVLLQEQIQKFHKEFGLTTLFVSHDLPEIFNLADTVIRIDQGKIAAQGSPGKVFLSNDLSAKFRIIGEVVEIVRGEITVILTIFTGSEMLKAVAMPEEAANLRVGDQVMLASKAFNPLIQKIDPR